jgi:hypothetical protein
MKFGVSVSELLNAIHDEVREVFEARTERESLDECFDVLALALNLALAHGARDCDVLEGLISVASKIRTRMNVVEAGGTWANAKEAEHQARIDLHARKV